MVTIWQNWHSQVERLLSDIPEPQSKHEFHREDNFERLQIPSASEFNDPQERMIILFTRLSVCFEYGLFFELLPDQNKGALLFGFDHGNVFSFENSGPELLKVRLPKSTPHKVQKLKSTEWFAKWNIRGLGENKDLTHLLLFPWPGIALLLSTQMADPWLKFHIEKTLNYLRQGIGETQD